MKKIISILLTLTLCLSMLSVPAFAGNSADVWDGTPATMFAGGDGNSAETAYEINTAAQLAYFAKTINEGSDGGAGKFYKLTADIDLNNVSWTPIGNTSSTAFKGTFDGNGHVIKNLTVTLGSGQLAAGLFGYINGATVKNVGIDTATVTSYGSYNGATANRQSVGVLIGVVNGTENNVIFSCFVRNAVMNIAITLSETGGTNAEPLLGAGPIVGDANGSTATTSVATVSGCYSQNVTITGNNGDSDVTTKNSTSGLVGGKPFNWSFTNCYVANVVITKFTNQRRFIRKDTSGTYAFSDCYCSDVKLNDATKSDAGITEVTAADKTTLQAVPTGLTDAFKADYASININGGYPILTWEKEIVIETGFASGKGVAGDEYVIENATQLALLADYVNGTDASSWNTKHYKLGADIDLSSVASWTPIGSASSTPFMGTFDGDGHVIKNLTITLGEGQLAAGLFGYINGATVKNVGIDNATVTAYDTYDNTASKRQSIGVLIGVVMNGSSDNVISSCFVRNAVMNITIMNDYNLHPDTEGYVSTTDQDALLGAGPIIGDATGNGASTASSIATVSSCYSYNIKVIGKGNCKEGTYVGTKNAAAGLIGGKPYGWTISNCYATGVTISGFGNFQHLFRTIESGAHINTITITDCFYSDFDMGTKSEPDAIVELSVEELKALPAELSDAFVVSCFEGYPALSWEKPDNAETVAQNVVNTIVILNAAAPQNGITLDPIAEADGVTLDVVWSSGNKNVITDTGVVYASTEQANTVTMTASVTYYGVTKTKEISITVPEVLPYVINNVEVTGDDGIIDNALVGGKSVSAVNLTRYAANGSATLLVALFDGSIIEDVVLTELTDSSVTRYGDKTVTLTEALELPASIKDTHEVKIFVWNKTTLVPMAQIKEIGKRNENPTLHVLGASTYQSYERDKSSPMYGMGDAMNVYLEDNVSVNNIARSGRSAKSWAVERFELLNELEQGDYLTISVGHNDQKTTADLYTTVSLDSDGNIDYTKSNTYVRYLQMYVDKAREKGANVIFITPMNRAYTHNTLAERAAAMIAFAKEKGIPVIDNNTTSIELFSKTVNEENPQQSFHRYFLIWGENSKSGYTKADMITRFGELGSEYDVDSKDDFTHFNIEGAAVMANFVVLGLKDIESPLSLYIDERCPLKTVDEIAAEPDCMATIITADDYTK